MINEYDTLLASLWRVWLAHEEEIALGSLWRGHPCFRARATVSIRELLSLYRSLEDGLWLGLISW